MGFGITKISWSAIRCSTSSSSHLHRLAIPGKHPQLRESWACHAPGTGDTLALSKQNKSSLVPRESDLLDILSSYHFNFISFLLADVHTGEECTREKVATTFAAFWRRPQRCNCVGISRASTGSTEESRYLQAYLPGLLDQFSKEVRRNRPGLVN